VTDKSFLHVPVKEAKEFLRRGTTFKMMAASFLFLGIGIVYMQWTLPSFGSLALSLGLTLIVAIAVSAIVGSEEFSQIFTSRIYDAMHAPEKEIDKHVLLESWSKLTSAILKSKLPQAHESAAVQMKKNFLEGKTKYHHEDNTVKIDIVVNDGIMVSTQTNSSYVVPEEITPTQPKFLCFKPDNSNDVLFTRKFDTNECKVTSLMIDTACITDKVEIVADKENSKLHLLEVPLRPYLDKTTKKSIFVEITTETTQKISEDPIIRSTLVRYVKGFQLRTRISEGYKSVVSRNGVGLRPFFKESVLDGEGYTVWNLPEGENLLLPGQGYLIVVIPAVGM